MKATPRALLTWPFRLCTALEDLAVEIRELRLVIEASLEARETERSARPKAVRRAQPEAAPEPELDLMLPGMTG